MLEEDEYTDRIEAIIQRDFFPDLPKLQNKLDWLQVRLACYHLVAVVQRMCRGCEFTRHYLQVVDRHFSYFIWSLGV